MFIRPAMRRVWAGLLAMMTWLGARSALAQGYAPHVVEPPKPATMPDPPYPPRFAAVPGHDPPAGYHLEEHARMGVVLAGDVVLTTSYLLSVAVAASSSNSDDRWMFVPVAGPFLDLGWRGHHGCGPYCDNDSNEVITRVFLPMLGAAQLTGAALLLAGIALPKKEFVRDHDDTVSARAPRLSSWAIVPLVSASQRGLVFRSEFF
jgi:hypothetical protein